MGSSDRFHVIKHANEAVDKVGKAEAGDRPALRNTKYVWLRNEADLTDPRLEVKRNLARQRLETARA